METPWYLIEYEEKEYLHNKNLQLKAFNCELDEHQHCELCWDRFSKAVNDLHFGYYESCSKSWICETCYNDFKDLFQWKVEQNESN